MDKENGKKLFDLLDEFQHDLCIANWHECADCKDKEKCNIICRAKDVVGKEIENADDK